MKHNGRNIINSNDVTLIGTNAGKTLDEVLENLQDTQEKLKSNVKWIYKYGGVGSSSGGGGGGTSSAWSVIFSLGGIRIPEQTENSTDIKNVIFKETGQKTLYFHINNPGGDTYIINCSYNNGKSKISNIQLNQSNRWSYSTTIPLYENGEITASVINGNEEEKQFVSKYIVNAYDMEACLVNNSGREWNKEVDSQGNKKYNFIIGNIKEEGINLQIKYTAYVDMSVSYTAQLDSNIIASGTKDLITGPVDQILFETAVFEHDDLTDELAGSYSIQSQVNFGDISEDFNINIDLIPNELYLKVEPQDPNIVIYKVKDPVNYQDPENPYTYQIGTRTFLVTPYNIAEGGRSVTIRCKIDNGTDAEYYVINNNTGSDSTIVNQGDTLIFPILFSRAGRQKITFIASSGDLIKEFVYYIYTELPSQTIEWFKSQNQVMSAYYRHGQPVPLSTSTNQFQLKLNDTRVDSNRYIIKASNDTQDDIIKIDRTQDLGQNEFMINIGIQYSYINNDELEILSITDSDPRNQNFFIHLYQNKILIGNSRIGGDRFFIEKQQEYDISNNSKYHLITFIRKHIRSTNIGNKYEISAYFDGILQGTLTTYVDNTLKCYNTINLYNGNYSINLIDFSYFNNGYLTDAKVVRYWYAYQNKIQQNTENIEYKNTLIEYFDEETTLEVGSNLLLNSHIYFSYDGINNLVKKIKVPLMCIEYSPSSNNNQDFFDWSDHQYTANLHDSTPVSINVKWSNGSGTDDTKLQDVSTINIPTPDGGTINATFTLDIQGSTTRTYKSKNYTLTLNTNDNSYLPIFTPKFDIDDKDTFLPENSFTLKADVVDSSHTNNTCVGKFVNDVSEQFEDAKQISSRYSGHIKNCLEGFPFLLFVHSANSANYYYLGIYNFNLGRSSNFNLGYCNLEALGDRITNSQDFKIYTVYSNSSGSNVGAELQSSLITAEINDNKAYYDFSQFDESILFPLVGIEDNDTIYMFDDILPDSSSEVKSEIQNFVENTARAGGYIFDRLGKGYNTDIEQNYTTQAGYVPNAHKQYEKTIRNSQYVFTQKDQEDLVFYGDDLLNMISNHGENYQDPAYCNYRSVVEYYTICMALGLLDSVEKNLNIKSWNSGKTFYLAFYDMDTCLGINNDGNNVSHFAFSDYWDTQNIQAPVEDIDQYNYILNRAQIYRDYQPRSSSGEFYDVPSSYIFAVAKYASTICKKFNLTNLQFISPQDLWHQWREREGCLRSAKYFVDTYYKGYMTGIDELMFNYNYRAKYYRELSQNGYDNDELKRFNGRSIEYTKDWLDKRFHILDAYFNISANTTIEISDGPNYTGHNNLENKIFESYPTSTAELSDDVYIQKSILGQNSSFSDQIDLIIQAPDYTPLIVNHSGSLSNYLLTNSNDKYRLMIPNTGNTKIVFGGSTMWTYLNSINSFAAGNIQIESEKLTVLRGDDGTVSTWDLNMPALEEVYLNGANYGGTLTFENFQNLTNVDISGSQISLTINGENVRYIDLSRIKSNKVTILNCNNIQNITFSNSEIGTCEINKVSYINENSEVLIGNTVYTNTLYLNGNKIRNLTLSSNNNSKLYISNDSILEKLDIDGFSEVTLIECSNLKQIISSQGALTKLTVTGSSLIESLKLNVTNCTQISLGQSPMLSSVTLTTSVDFSKVTTLNLNNGIFTNINLFKIENGSEIPYFQESQEEGFIDLSPFTELNNLNLSKNPNFSYLRLNNDKNKPIKISNDFKECTNLTRIYGHIEITNVYQTFYNLRKFSIHGDIDNTWKGYDKKKYIKTSDSQIVSEKKYYTKIQDRCIYTEVLNPIISEINDYYERTEIIQNPLNILSEDLSKDKNQLTLYDDYFQSGNNVTNIKFSFSSGTTFHETFYNTNITQFDIYYIFNALGLSNINVNIKLGEQAFYGLSTMFSYSSGNQFDRNTFYKCSKINSISSGNGRVFNTGATLIYSPTVQNGISQKDGLFSPLTNLTTLSLITSGAWYTDDYVFYDNTELTGIYHQSINLIQNVCNYSKQSDVPSSLKRGDFTHIFEKNNSLSELTRVFNGVIIDYDTLHLPSSLKSIKGCFNASTGYGDIVWDNIFNKTSYSSLKTIADSFKVTESGNPNSVKVGFEIYDDMFNKMRNLENIGFEYDSLNYGGVSYYASTTPQRTTSTPSYSFGFYGEGINKYFRNGIFTSNITSQLTSLKNFVGFFAQTASPQYRFDFPGNMFNNNLQLSNISCLFYNADSIGQMDLTSNGFKNNTKLTYANALFYRSATLSGNLSKPIPNKFFYHGHTQASIKFYGTNNEQLKDEYNNYIDNQENYENEPELEEATIIYYIPNTKISQAMYCFHGQDQIPSYSMTNNLEQQLDNYIEELLSDEENQKFYRNRNFIPFQYYTKTKGKKLSTRDNNNKLYTCEYDISLIQDGSYNISNLNYYCKENVSSDNDNYLFTPDLLYYFSNTATLCIKGMFKWCGQGTNYPSTATRRCTGGNITSALVGRICPYMFNYVSNVVNLQEFFQWMKGIKNIPNNLFSSCSNLEILCNTFSGLYFSSSPNFSVLQTSTNKAKDLRGTFSCCRYANSGYDISNSSVFRNLKVSNISGMFSARPVTLTSDKKLISIETGDTATTEQDTSFIANNIITNLLVNNKQLSVDNTTCVFYKIGGIGTNITESNIIAQNILNNTSQQ